MSTGIYFDNIQKKLLLYAEDLQISNAMGPTSKSRDAENLFSRLFNIIFSWETINANDLAMNQQGYDLFDASQSIYIQITAVKSYKSKIEYSLKGIQQEQIAEDSEFIIFFIRNKITPKYRVKVRENGLIFWGADLQWLLKEMLKRCDLLALRKIDELLTAEMTPLVLKPFSQTAGVIEVPVRQELNSEKKGIYLYREELIQELFNFSQKGGGLLTGGPGFGKSTIIDALQRHYYQQDIPCYVVRINELVEAGDAEIGENMGLDKNWLSALYSIKRNNKNSNALLIFDGLDTAKEHQLRKSILKAIRSAQKKLSGFWNIMAGCRIYDAAKSEELQLLFPDQEVPKGIINCRNMEVPPFSDAELDNIFLSNPKMASLMSNCTDELKNLLKVPYFMGLLEELTHKNYDELLNVSGINSESQLLGFYWQKKIGYNRRLELFTRSLAIALTDLPSLSIETYSIVSMENQEEAEELLTQGIIIEHGMNRKSISFSHNILLEFAVSRFMLFESASEQISFIENHKKLPFLFRQSFIYFYNDLWDHNRRLFWEHYFCIKEQEEPLFRLFHQTVLEYVLIETYKVPTDLLPLQEVLYDTRYAEAVRRVLESMWFIHKGKLRLQDVALILNLSDRLHPDFLWQFSLHIESGIELYLLQQNNQVLFTLSQAAVKLMHFALNERLAGNNRDYIDRNAGYRGIKNVCRLIGYQPQEARKILNEIMELLKEEDFPIVYFQTLAECIINIFEFDPQLGVHIYKVIYFHRENSDKVTNMGTAVMSLNSNRRQDFAHTSFMLEQRYKEMLEVNFASAMQLGVYIVNKVNAKECYRPEDNLLPVRIAEVNGMVLRDYSSYEKDEKNGPYLHGKTIFEVLEQRISEEQEIGNLEELLYQITGFIQAGCLWRKFLVFLKENVGLFPKLVFQVLENKVFFANDETLFEAAALLENAWILMDNDQRRLMEEIVFHLADPQDDFQNEAWQRIRLSRILSVIPAEDLQMPDSIKFLKENELRENKPTLSRGLQIAQAKSLSREERMMGFGFLEEDQTTQIYTDFIRLQSFYDLFRNKEENELDSVSYEKEYESAVRLFKIAESRILSPELKQASCDTVLAGFANILSAQPEKKNSYVQDFLKRVATHYILLDDYKEKIFEKGDMGGRHGGFFSPNARTSSVRTAMNLMFDSHDTVLENLVLDLFSDNQVIIRLRALSSLPYFWNTDKVRFWRIVYERAVAETDGHCLQEIIAKLCFDDIIKNSIEDIQKISVTISRKLYDSSPLPGQELWRVYCVLLLIRIMRHDRLIALKEIKDILGNREFSRALVFEVNGVIDSFNKGCNFIVNLEKFSVLFEILKEVLEFRFSALSSFKSYGEESIEHFEAVDNVIQNVHFILDFENNNNGSRKLSRQERRTLIAKVLPILEFAVEESEQIQNGFMLAHTGFYFMKSLNFISETDPARALSLSKRVVSCAAANGFTYDPSTLKEIVVLTDRLISSHKDVLFKGDNFDQLIVILDHFAQSGSQEALQLIWSLKEAF